MAQATDTDIREIRDLLLGLNSKIEALDKKIEAVDKKLEIHIAKTDERFNTIDQRFNSLENQIAEFKKSTDSQIADIKLQMRSQDNRFWTFFGWLFVAAIGVIAKLVLQIINFATWGNGGKAPRRGFHSLHPLQNLCVGVLAFFPGGK
ncbi:hypothetical protein [Pseudanabaena sp. PCC 6802]|uniref:hypothetical protein n=1 Tax=Pseudanabaena sp. PCC 6802 TaxID=118173 RepID=UPI000345F1B5|nr:hypothetical protein [Pseudanabaena sp. PCC 6802]